MVPRIFLARILKQIHLYTHGENRFYLRFLYSHAYSPNLQGFEIGFTLLFDFIVSRVIDLIGEGGYAGKGFMIITKRPDQLC